MATNFSRGIATVTKRSIMGKFPLPDDLMTRSKAGVAVTSMFDDYYRAGTATTDYVLTGASSTAAIIDGAGGLLALTPGAATTVTTFAHAHGNWSFAAGYAVWYRARVKLALVGAGVIAYAGLQNGTGATNTDGLFFNKPTGAAGVWSLISRVGSANTTLWSSANASVAATFKELGFVYDGANVLIYEDGALVGRSLAPTLTAVALTPFYQITPTATDVMTIDHLTLAAEMVR